MVFIESALPDPSDRATLAKPSPPPPAKVSSLAPTTSLIAFLALVPNLPIYSEMYIPEKIVRFKNGEERTILRSVPMGGYIHVFVSGGLLDASKVGVPNQFIILKKIK